MSFPLFLAMCLGIVWGFAVPFVMYFGISDVIREYKQAEMPEDKL